MRVYKSATYVEAWEEKSRAHGVKRKKGRGIGVRKKKPFNLTRNWLKNELRNEVAKSNRVNR